MFGGPIGRFRDLFHSPRVQINHNMQGMHALIEVGKIAKQHIPIMGIFIAPYP